MTEVLRVDATHPDDAAMARAAACLRSGGLVAFPTETVYGLGVHALDPAAVARLFEAKQRPADDPLIVHISAFAAVERLAVDVPDTARQLAARFWPGPLTLVVPARPGLADGVRSSTGRVGIRVPAHGVAQALALAFGSPITATSANASGAPPTADPDEVRRQLPALEWLIDAGRLAGGPPSTLVQVEGGHVQVLREGAVSRSRVLESLVPAR